MPKRVQDPRRIHPRMAHDFTVHKQALQTDQPVTYKKAHHSINHLYSHFIVTNKNKVIAFDPTTIIILVDDR